MQQTQIHTDLSEKGNFIYKLYSAKMQNKISTLVQNGDPAD